MLMLRLRKLRGRTLKAIALSAVAATMTRRLVPAAIGLTLVAGAVATFGLATPASAAATYLVDTFANAPGYSSPGGTQTGTLYAGTNYVYCRTWGPIVADSYGNYNHWWLQTDLDTGNPWQNQYVSAYYLSRWGNDVAKDNSGNDIPNCPSSSPPPPPSSPPPPAPVTNTISADSTFVGTSVPTDSTGAAVCALNPSQCITYDQSHDVRSTMVGTRSSNQLTVTASWSLINNGTALDDASFIYTVVSCSDNTIIDSHFINFQTPTSLTTSQTSYTVQLAQGVTYKLHLLGTGHLQTFSGVTESFNTADTFGIAPFEAWSPAY
jgi:hypothetical protein